jgi:hypothetical protein
VATVVLEVITNADVMAPPRSAQEAGFVLIILLAVTSATSGKHRSTAALRSAAVLRTKRLGGKNS